MRNLLVIFLLINSITCIAQQSRQYTFRHFSLNHGLASTSINMVTQDKDGYMWIATLNGLQRYDGSRFITFKNDPANASSIPDNKIVLLYYDRSDNLWVMGENGNTGIFDTRKFIFKKVPIIHPGSQLFIQQGFLELPTGELLMMKTDGDILQYSPKSNRFETTTSLLPVPAGWKRNWIYWDTAINKLWMSCDSGLALYDPRTKHLSYRGHNIDKDPVIDAFKNQLAPARVNTDTRNNVVFIHWPRNSAAPNIHRFNRKLSKAEILTTGQAGYHEIGYFLRQRNGRYWVYGLPLLAEWVEGPGKPGFNLVPNAYVNEHSLKFDYMHQVYEDKESNIWLATDNGLYVFNPDAQVFNTYYILKESSKLVMDAPIQAVQQIPDGRIFVGAWGSGGVTAYDPLFQPVKLPAFPPGEISVWDMDFHPVTGDLWISMQAGSIVIYQPKSNRFQRVVPAIFGLSTIRQAVVDPQGNVWFGTQNGRIIKWDYKKSGGNPSRGYEIVMQTGLVHKLYYDNKGYIWAATLLHGLVKINASTGKLVKQFTTSDKEGERLFNNSPTDITFINDSTLAVAAGCINLVNTTTGKISYVGTEQGLPSNTAVSIVSDSSGTVWVGMTNGLCKFNPAKMLITCYDRRDGIAEDKFQKAGAKALNDGRLVFFTDHNMLVFQPGKLGPHTPPAAPKITGLTLAGKSLSIDSIISAGRTVLDHNNTSISISFSGLSYLQQQKVHYYYIMDNLDKNWTRTDKPIEVVYNYLPPGEYTFKVKSENADGVSNLDTATLRIQVRPPFWQTWWFISVVLLVLVAILYLVDRERMQRIKSMQALRNQIRGNLRDEMSTALNNINILSEMAKIKADRNLVHAKDLITQISHKSREMIEVMDDTLWSIDPNNDSMEHTLLRIREMTEGIMIATGTDIDLAVNEKVAKLHLDMRSRYDLYFYYKEAIQQLAADAGCRQLFVNFDIAKSKLVLEILGEGSPEFLDGLEERLDKLVQDRITDMPALLDVVSEGNRFSVVLLLNLK